MGFASRPNQGRVQGLGFLIKLLFPHWYKLLTKRALSPWKPTYYPQTEKNMKGGDTKIALFALFPNDTLSCMYKLNLAFISDYFCNAMVNPFLL